MPKQFQHQVCYSVYDRVTFVNGEWQGADIPESERKPEDAESCMLVRDYLGQAGAEGWELVTVLETPNQNPKEPFVRTLYLKREIT